MVSRLKNLRDLVYSIIRKQGVGKGPGITNIGTNTLKLNQEAMDIIAEMQKAGYKIENIDEASIKIFLNNRNQPAPTGKQIIDSMEKTDIYSQDNPFIGFKPEIVKDTKKVKDKTRSGKINYEVMENFLGTKLRGNESFDELLEIEKKAKAKKPPEDKADGGRIGFGEGSTGSGLPAIQLESQSKMEQYGPGVEIPGSPRVPMGKFGPVNIGIFGGGGYSKNEIIPGVDRAATDQNYGITGQIPIGNTGFTIGGDYMKSRANERFTGGDNQVLKTVPIDSDRFNVGINFTKTFKDGGRIGFKDGTPKNPSRRNFLKLMGGLAALPIDGKFFKGAKTATKIAETTTSGVPAYFPKLVQKIKEFGTDVTQKSATVERQRVIEYKNYELTEDLTNGDMTVVKTDEGMGTFQTADGDFDSFDGISSQEVMDFKKGYQDIDTTTGKTIEVPSQYEEVTVRPDMDGKMKDVEDGLDNLDEILNEVGEVQTKKKKLASGGVAYMLGE